MNTADIVLSYAERGWRVLPIPDGKKHPVLLSWTERCLTTQQIKDLWYDDAGPGVSILTGHAFDVLDVDAHEGKPKGMDYLGNAVGRPLPKGPVVLTGSGGLQYYVQPTGAANINLRIPGVDYRGIGGQVMAPPSRHPDTGQRYRWLDGHGAETPLPPAPYWLRSIIDAQATAATLRPAPDRQRPDRPDIAGVAALLGLQGKHAGRHKFMTLCPFHVGSGQPSMAIYTDDDHFRCWSPRCGAWGDSIDLMNHRAATGETF